MRNTLKIAVQISGLLRDFQESYRSLQRSLLDHYDCDIFVAAATGDDRFASDQDIVREIGAKAYVLNNDLPSNFGEMVKEWNDTIAWSVTGLNIFTRVASVYAALFKRWQANELRLRSDTHYDAVLVTRADIVYGEPFTDDVLEATQTHLMIPRHGDWHGGFNDHFFLARPKHATTASMLIIQRHVRH